jgi:hypothetical protein
MRFVTHGIHVYAVGGDKYGFDNKKPAFWQRKTLHICLALGNCVINVLICVLIGKVYVRRVEFQWSLVTS